MSSTVSNNTAMESFEVDVEASDSIKERIVTWDVNIALLRGKWFNKIEFGGDWIEILIAPDTVTGVIVAPLAIGDNVLTVNDTVIENIEVGYFMSIGGQDLGRVLYIDYDNSQITVKNPVDSAHNAMSYVKQTIKMIPHLYLDAVDDMMSFEGGEDTMILPANTPMVIRYHNVNQTEKHYSVKIEYHY